MTPLVGREPELVALRGRALDPDVRLVTLLGPPGVGKTRLALALAEAVRPDFPDGVRFVSLGPLRDPDLVVPAVARAFGVREPARGTLVEALAAALRGRSTLLVLDNVEHLLPAAPRVAALLLACRGLTVVATSRTALRVSGEQQFPVAPLALPDPARLPVGDDLARVPAVQLFLQRARAVAPDFALTAATARAVAEICVRLDGLPLAIELAAAHSKVLAPPDLLARLERRLPPLVDGPADAPDRQRSLAAALDWSYDLLPAAERRVFGRLGVFRGRFTVEAAATVASDSGEAGPDIFGALASLADQSLIRAEPDAGLGPAFSLLETLRAYAVERLAASGELAACRARHAAYFLALAERAEAELWGPRAGWWVAQLEGQHDDLRAALRWLIERGDTEPARRLGGALAAFWKAAGHFREGLTWLTEIRALPGEEETPGAAQALLGASTLLAFQAEADAALPLARESLRRWRALGDGRRIAWSLLVLGVLARLRGERAAARSLLAEGADVACAAGDDAFESMCRDGLAAVAYDEGDFATARAQAEVARGLFHRAGHRSGLASALLNLGWVSYQEHDYAAAERLFEQSLSNWREGHEWWGVGWTLAALGHAAAERGDGERARSRFAEALRLGAAHGDRSTLTLALLGAARLLAVAGASEPALRLIGAVTAYGEAVNYVPSPTRHALVLRWLAPARAALAPEAAAAAFAAGRALALEDAVADALGALGRLELPAGPPDAPADGGAWAGLTAREREVAALLARGLTNREIAGALSISEATAETHVKHILNKLGVNSRKAVAARVARRDRPTFSA